MNPQEIKRNNKGQFLKGGPSPRKTHGLAGGRFYKTYYDMRHRCENPTDKKYRIYGGKGVRVLWETFEDFRLDIYDRDWETL